MTIARIKNNGDLQIIDEIIEYPSELEGGRNLISETLIGRHGLDSMDISRYKSKGVVSFAISAPYEGVSIRAHPLLPNTEYVIRYRYRKTSGTLLSFGGHTDASWNNNTTYVDGEERGAYSATSSAFVLDDDNEHEVVVYISTPGEIVASHLIYIQPNRGNSTPVSVDIYDLKLEKGNKATDWTPAPEDLGMEYPSDIQHFATGFRADGKVMVREFIEGEDFSFSTDKKMYLNELGEGVDLDG